MAEITTVTLCCALLAGVSLFILQLVCNAVPQPFIDEFFHIPQAQKYCIGSFSEWNDKITTLPGLYVFSLVIQAPIGLLAKSYYCSVYSLRFVNVLCNVVSFVIVYKILKVSHQKKDDSSKVQRNPKDLEQMLVLQSISIATFPVFYFFSFLYYTDSGSTMFILASYYANLRSYHKTSASLGFISVLFRQTNIAWVAFMAGTTIAKELMSLKEIREIETSKNIKDKLARFLTNFMVAVARYLLIFSNLLGIIALVWPYAIVFLLFCLFVIINGSIVVGDKSNHEATFHGSQMLYFLCFTLFFASPFLISRDRIERFIRSISRYPYRTFTVVLVIFICVNSSTKIHDFLLADNRHYTFYLWSYFLRHSVVRYLLIPVYVYSCFSMNHAANRPCLWTVVYIVCVALVTVPQKLFELRYFIIPYLVFRLNILTLDKKTVILEFLLYLTINVSTLLVFLNKTFMWPDFEEPQRIIW